MIAKDKPQRIGQKGVFKILKLGHALDDVVAALEVLPDLGLGQGGGVVKKLGDFRWAVLNKAVLKEVLHAL